MTELLINQLRERVIKTPDKIAIQTNTGKSITFNQLWGKSSEVANYLKSQDISEQDNIGLICAKSIEYIISMVGVLMTGASFTPVEASQPQERINYIIEKVKPKLILTNTNLKKEFNSKFKTLNINRDILDVNIQNKFNQANKTDIPLATFKGGFRKSGMGMSAYIIFTSGSTGKPKGVEVSHNGLSSVINEQIKLFELNETSVSYFIYSISFDASLSDIWTSLISGATLVIEQPFVFKGEKELFETFEKFKITHVDLPPSIFKFLHPENAPEKLTTIILGGEVIDSKHVQKWVNYGKNIITVYGPTEATICTSMEKCSSSWDKPYIGFPLPEVNYQVDIFQDNTGELLISGNCLALGYFEDDKLNTEKFFYKNNTRYYKTGDLVKVNPGNRLEFIGRIDRQIKYKGNLICPEEIEGKLNNYSGISNSIVIFDGIFLKCFVETDLSTESTELEKYLKQFFSKSMIPNKWSFHKKFPVLTNGKIDIKKLTVNSSNSELSPVENLGEILEQGFKNILNLEKVDLNISFFDLGGDSFSVLALLAEYEKNGLKISAEDIYKYKNINQLAKNLKENSHNDNNTEKLLQEVEIIVKQFPINYQQEKVNSINTLPENILLTGATGFLGSRILIDLLEVTSANIYCLVRDTKKIAEWDIYQLNIHRIKIISGDISKPVFDLSDEVFAELQITIDSIYHIAADINHFKTYEELKVVNVESLLTILELLSKGKTKSLHYASSLSVFVDAEPLPKICFENDLLENTKMVYGGYAQTKWVSEKVLQKAENYGNIFIYRFGLLTQESLKGFSSDFDWFNSFIKGLAELKVIPKLDFDSLSFDFTPVSYASKAMIYNSLYENNNDLETLHISHISSGKQFSFNDLIKALKASGIKIEILENEQWLNYLSDKKLSKPAMVTFLALKIQNSHLSIFKAGNTIFDTTKTKEITEKYDLKIPELNQETLNNYVKNLLGY